MLDILSQGKFRENELRNGLKMLIIVEEIKRGISSFG